MPGPRSELPAFVLRLAQQDVIDLSIRQLRAFTSDLQNLQGVARHLHRQVPIRLARRLVELDNALPKLQSHPHVQTVRATYLRSLEALMAHQAPETIADAHHFAETANAVLNGPALTNTIEKLCMAVQDLKAQLSTSEVAAAERTLHHFYTSRLSTRLALEQLLQMAAGRPGLIVQCCPHDVAQECVKEVTEICRLVYGATPPIAVTGPPDFHFLHVPGVLYLVLKEILKNAARATMEAPGDPDDRPIQVHIVPGKDDVLLRVQDQGGGFPRALLPRAFSYLYTTVERVSGAETPYLNLAGYGRGLPLARLYCEYFGGALHLLPLHGVGTECFIYVSRDLDYTHSLDSLNFP